MNPTARAFLDIAKEEGNTATLESIRNAAFEKMASGEVKTIVSFSINGKSTSFNVSKAADVLFTEVSWAIRQYNRGTVTGIEWDLTGI